MSVGRDALTSHRASTAHDMSAFTISAAAARVNAAPAFANKASKVRLVRLDAPTRRRSPNPEGPAATRADRATRADARDGRRDARARWDKIRTTHSRRVGRPTRRAETRRRESDD